MRPIKSVWRNDFKSDEKPTLNKIVLCAEVDLRIEGYCRLAVNHVLTIQGPAFMPVVYVNNAVVETGKIFYGDDDIAFMYAASRGRRMFNRQTGKMHDALEEQMRREEAMTKTRSRKKAMAK
jgi:hypothetical protein